MVKYAEDYQIVSRWLLRICGIWALESKNKYINSFYKVFAPAMVSFITIYTVMEFINLGTIEDDDLLFKCISMWLTHLITTIKVFFFLVKGDRIKEFIALLENKELRYEDFAEKNFFPGKISQRCKLTVMMVTACITVACILTEIMIFLPVVSETIAYMTQNDSTRQLPKSLPYPIWLPFRYDSGITYIYAMAYEAFAYLIYTYGVSGFQGLFVGLMHCIASHLEIMQGAFLTVRERSLKKIKGLALAPNNIDNSLELNAVMNAEMRTMCRHLEILLTLSKNLEDLHKYITLCDISCNLFAICTCLYSMSVLPVFSEQFNSLVIYLPIIGSEVYLYCYFGNEVTTRAEDVGDSIYHSDWFGTDSSFKKTMLIAMTRTQKPVYFTAGGFAALILTTYVTVMRASFSFFTFLQNTRQ